MYAFLPGITVQKVVENTKIAALVDSRDKIKFERGCDGCHIILYDRGQDIADTD